MSCVTPSKKTTIQVAREIIENAKNCALITLDENGVAHARAMDPFLPENDFSIWLATNPLSEKVYQIKKNANVTLYYFDPETNGYITLQGKAVLIDSQEEKRNRWKDEWQNFYQNRDSDFLLIKFTPNNATIISEKYNILGDSITWKAPNIKL